MKYVIYLRVSGIEQDDEAQHKQVMDFLREHDTSDFRYEIYSDVKSARKSMDGRPGIQAALQALQRGDIFVAVRIDRVVRIPLEGHQLIEDFKQRGIQWRMIEQPFLNNEITLGVFLGVAAEESKMNGQRVKARAAVKRAKGERVSGEVPYGYRLDMVNLVPIKKGHETVMKPGKLIPYEPEQAGLRLMIELFDAGYSYKDITAAVNSAGYRNRVDLPFQKSTIHRILARTKRTRPSDQPQPAPAFQMSG